MLATGSGGTSPSFSARCSSWVWARRSAVCRAITRCRSAVRQHFSHWQARYLQYRLWPFSPIFSPWLRQRAQFGGVRGFSELLHELAAPLPSVRESYPESDIASVQRSCDTIQDAPHARVVPRMSSKQALRLRQPCDTPPQLALLLLALLSSRLQHLSDYALPIYQSNCCVREPIPTLNAALSMPPNAPGCIGWPLDIGGKKHETASITRFDRFGLRYVMLLLLRAAYFTVPSSLCVSTSRLMLSLLHPTQAQQQTGQTLTPYRLVSELPFSTFEEDTPLSFPPNTDHTMYRLDEPTVVDVL